MNDMASSIFQWLNQNPHLSGLITFVIACSESIVIFGMIVPGFILMTAIGTLAGSGIIPLYLTFFWAILGALTGDSISYWLGAHFNERIQTFWPFRNFPALLKKGEFFFQQHGGKSVFIGRFVAPVRTLVPLIAGMLKMPFFQFIVTCFCSAILWAPFYMLPGILIGAASLELPPDVAVHALISLFLTLLLIIFLIWSVIELLRLISRQIEQRLIKIWDGMSDSTKFHPITTLLHHHNPNKKYGQLILGFYFFITFFLLIGLTYVVKFHPSTILSINNLIFHSLRSVSHSSWNSFFLIFTFLGDKKTLLPLTFTLAIWFFWKKRPYTAFHIIALGILTTASIFILKHITHFIRPWGIMHHSSEFSFPSGHVALSVAFYTMIIFLFIYHFKIHSRKWLYYFLGFLIFLISLSRLYLGAHWFTDVIGGLLVGITIVMGIILSWNRVYEKRISGWGIFWVTVITLSFSFSLNFYMNFKLSKYESQQRDWPIYTVSIQNWWKQTPSLHLPLYRVNRFGLSRQPLALQWVGKLSDIQRILQDNQWIVPTQTTWIDVLHRLANIQSNQHLPLVSPLYLDKKPVLILIKQTNKQFPIVLHLWKSHLHFNDSPLILWVGTIEMIPSTYSWLFPQKQKFVQITPELLFKKIPHSLHLQYRTLFLKESKKPISILLIKPKDFL